MSTTALVHHHTEGRNKVRSSDFFFFFSGKGSSPSVTEIGDGDRGVEVVVVKIAADRLDGSGINVVGDDAVDALRDLFAVTDRTQSRGRKSLENPDTRTIFSKLQSHTHTHTRT